MLKCFFDSNQIFHENVREYSTSSKVSTLSQKNFQNLNTSLETLKFIQVKNLSEADFEIFFGVKITESCK